MPPTNTTHDGLLNIATGRSRRETNWKNKEIQWSQLVSKISKTHYTAETHSEYVASKKVRQDEIKDIGGFVGGYLSNGKRKTGSVANRQLITLDIDFPKSDIWEDFVMLYNNAAALYSTHKHSAENPRYRLLIPLDRPVFADEYVAIARRVAGNLGINSFGDATTFRPTQLMYWPSTSKDGEYVFEAQDGPWLIADEVLASYRDWTDSCEWPISDRENAIIDKAIKKQGDPLEKPGVVGAFCRTYNIHEAIETYLSDIYEPCDIENRYTYKEGSTSAGLVVYEDKFAYSHHGTDPVSNKLCNAFDLIRHHRFGLKDEDAREGLPGNKLPSYIDMCELASKDVKVRKQIGAEKKQEAINDFAGLTTMVPEVIEEGSDDWLAQLDVDRKGNYYPTINNLVLMLENDPAFKNNISYDEFEQRPVIRRDLPWRKVTHNTRYLTDRDDDNIEHYLEKSYDISTAKIEKALSVVYERHLFHPVRDYLNSVDWDGENRLEAMLIDYMGAEDNEYVRMVTRKTMVAAVARVFRPGIKFDYVLTLVGEEGKGKSTIFNKLGRQWFSDTFNLHMLQGKEAYEQLRGAWIIEIGELSGMAKAEGERVKGFLSAREDRYRQSYGRRVEIFPRQCIVLATTNKRDFLRSQTGNRRFWPVMIDINTATKDVFRGLNDTEIDQIWAEAMMLYKAGEKLYLPKELEDKAVLKQKEHTEEHPWTGIIETYLNKKMPAEWLKMDRYARLSYLSDDDELQEKGTVERDRVCIMEIWNEALNRRESIDEYSAAIIRNIMRSMPNWNEEQKPVRYNSYGLQRRGYILERGVTNAVTKTVQNVKVVTKKEEVDDLL